MSSSPPPAVPSRPARLIATLATEGKLAGLALWEALLAILMALGVCLSVLVVGVPLAGWALGELRVQTTRQRRLVPGYTGTTTRGTDPALPDRRPGVRGWAEFFAAAMAQPRTRRDLVWMLTNPFVGLALALAPIVLIADGLFGLLMLALWPAMADNWYLFIPILGPGTAVLAAVLGVVQIVLGVRIADPCLRLHGRWVTARLTDTSTAELRQRVDRLVTSRADTVEFQARELERIERDLHDGAQARLVAMGMTLTAASRLIATDPDRAQQLMQQAKDSSAAALAELRNLVRGIHPPVLADRGLAEAVQSLALESVVPVQTQISLSARPPLPLESAVYFAVKELLTNVAKHSGAGRALVQLTDQGGYLTAAVSDDGVGGASTAGGSGLAGIRRRLAAFDGELGISSAPRWATVVTVSIPLGVPATAARSL